MKVTRIARMAPDRGLLAGIAEGLSILHGPQQKLEVPIQEAP